MLLEPVAVIERQARVFTRYLLGLETSAYVTAKYAAYCAAHPAAPNGFDAALLRLAARGPLWTALCASYAQWFFREAVLRSRLVLLLALLECTAEGEEAMQVQTDSATVLLYLPLGMRVAGHVLLAAAGLVVLTPVRLLSSKPEAA